MFADGEDEGTDPDDVMIMVDENSKGEIGDAVVASDADNDVLLYSLGPAEIDDSPNQDNGEFTINARSGQISVGSGTALDFETALGTGDEGTQTTENTYFVTVIATDPSGATGEVTGQHRGG